MSNSLLKKVTSAVVLTAMVASTVGAVSSTYAATTEVEAANALAGLGVIADQSSNVSAYRLGDTITRREMLKVMVNLAGSTVENKCEGKFADLPATDWGCKYAETALAAGFIAANTNFRPNDNVSKAEALKMVMKAKGIEKDASATSWEAAYVNAAVTAGLIMSSFSDYTTASKRGFTFTAAANATEEDDLGLDDLLDDTDDTTSTGTTDEETTDTPTSVKSGDVELSLSPESPTSTIAAGSSRTPVMAIDVTAGDEDITLKETTLKFVGSGNEALFDDLAIYLNSTKVTKQDSKNFDDENEAVLTFDKNFVVKAGETQTLVVTTTLSGAAANTYQTMQVAMTELVSSAANVEGLTVTGPALVPVSVTNKATVTIDNDTASEEVKVGESVKLAGFELEETSKKEDVVVKAVTFTVSGSIDAEDDLSDLVLYADGKEVAADLSVNSDDEIVADLDYTIAADDKVKFELKGTVTGSIGETIELVFDDADDVYVVGKTTGVSLSIAGVTTTDIATAKEIEGSEINVSFDKSSTDEAKPNAEAVAIGTVKLTAANEYTVDELKVTVTGDTDAIDTLELDGSAYDSKSGNVYTFEDITISAGETLSLPLTMDVIDDTSFNGESLTFSVSIAKVTDEENDETYEGSALNTVLSSNSFSTKTIDIESSSFTLNQTTVSEKELVLGNGVEVVLYKGKVSVGDADSVLVNDMNFTATLSSTGFDVQDVIDSATLNIGGKTYDADVQSNGLDFTSISNVIAAGSDNVEVTLTAVLKDNDSVDNGDEMIFAVNSGELDLEDSDGEALEAGNVDVNATAGTNNVVLNEMGTFTLNVVANGDYKDSVKSTVLAGASSVALAELEIEAEDEDVKVKELVLNVSGTGVDFSSTLNNVRLVNAATNAVIADGAVVTYSANKTVITFKDDFVMLDSSNEVKALLVADLSIYTDKGGAVSAQTGDIAIEFGSIDTTGVSSNEDLSEVASGTGETVAVVPALVTVSIVDEIGANDKDAIIRFTVDKGTNDFTDDSIYFTGMTLETAVASGVIVRNDDDAAINLSGATSTGITVANTTIDTEIINNDEFTIKVENDGDEVRIVAEGIHYTIGAGSTVYSIVNDKVLNLGEYDAD